MGILEIIICAIVILCTFWFVIHCIALLRLMYLYEKLND